MDTVECAYAEGPASGGKSNAWIVRGRDNHPCIIKFHLDGDRTALNEPACACLARHFKLPSPKPFLALLSAGHAEQINAQRRRAKPRPIGTGPHFGAKFTASFLAAEPLSRKMGRNLAAGDASNIDIVPDMLGLDTLVQNDDRHCNNAGVEPDVLGPPYSYYVFDFDRALGGHDRPARRADALHRGLRPTCQSCLAASAARSRGGFEGSTSAFEASIGQGIDPVLDDLPPERGPAAQEDAGDLKEAMAGPGRGAPAAAIMKNKILEAAP